MSKLLHLFARGGHFTARIILFCYSAREYWINMSRGHSWASSLTPIFSRHRYSIIRIFCPVTEKKMTDWTTRCPGVTNFLAVAGVHSVAGMPAVAGVPAVAVTKCCGLFYHVNDGITVKYSFCHPHQYRQSFLLVRHRHSVMSLSPISPITEHYNNDKAGHRH